MINHINTFQSTKFCSIKENKKTNQRDKTFNIAILYIYVYIYYNSPLIRHTV